MVGSNQPEMIILSAYNGEDRLFNQRQHDILTFNLTELNVPHDTLIGCYEGVREMSVIIPAEYRKEALVLGQLFHRPLRASPGTVQWSQPIEE